MKHNAAVLLSNYAVPALTSLTGSVSDAAGVPRFTMRAYTHTQAYLSDQLRKLEKYAPGAIPLLNKQAALEWIAPLEKTAESVGQWSLPHVTPGDEGEVSLEWWRGDKKLTMYVSAEAIQVIQVWGADIVTEMMDHQLRKASAFQAHWRWLWS